MCPKFFLESAHGNKRHLVYREDYAICASLRVFVPSCEKLTLFFGGAAWQSCYAISTFFIEIA
jgi:hypothetical protein